MLVQAVELCRRYTSGGEVLSAIDDLNFDLEAGEFVAVMGPSGSGKTTLMNLLGLLDNPSSGTLSLLGDNVGTLSLDRQAKLRNRHIGFVFQSYNLLARSTALENVELPLVYAGITRRERRRRAGQALERVGLSQRSDHWPTQLSGGEQQRVAIARATVCEPDLILADEPTGALDTRSGFGVLALFQELNLEGCAVVMVTHDQNVAGCARRVIELRDGGLQSDRPVAERTDAAARLQNVNAGIAPVKNPRQ